MLALILAAAPLCHSATPQCHAYLMGFLDAMKAQARVSIGAPPPPPVVCVPATVDTAELERLRSTLVTAVAGAPPKIPFLVTMYTTVARAYPCPKASR